MLKVKMNGNSRLAKQFRFADAALELGNSLACGQRIHLTRDHVVNYRGYTDALGRVLSRLGAKPRYQTSGLYAMANYLNVAPERIPSTVQAALQLLQQANDSCAIKGFQRRGAVALALRKLAGAVRNARIGR